MQKKKRDKHQMFSFEISECITVPSIVGGVLPQLLTFLKLDTAYASVCKVSELFMFSYNMYCPASAV